MKDINDMTEKEFLDIEKETNTGRPIQFDSLVILPTKYVHDSGYRSMDFVLIKDSKPLIRLDTYSDVIHINGITGHGDLSYRKFDDPLESIRWCIDCLKTSNLLRLYTIDTKLVTYTPTLSSFEVFIDENKKLEGWSENN